MKPTQKLNKIHMIVGKMNSTIRMAEAGAVECICYCHVDCLQRQGFYITVFEMKCTNKFGMQI